MRPTPRKPRGCSQRPQGRPGSDLALTCALGSEVAPEAAKGRGGCEAGPAKGPGTWASKQRFLGESCGRILTQLPKGNRSPQQQTPRNEKEPAQRSAPQRHRRARRLPASELREDLEKIQNETHHEKTELRSPALRRKQQSDGALWMRGPRDFISSTALRVEAKLSGKAAKRRAQAAACPDARALPSGSG